MALSASPRKIVPLPPDDDSKPQRVASHSRVTKRVFYCGVVVEGSENGRRLPDDIQDLVLSLGSPLSSSSNVLSSSSSSESLNDTNDPTQRKRALTDASALSSVVNELVTSERSYVRRLQILKNDYADPLRNFARSKDTAIIPAYEAKTLFGNIDNLLPVNEAFLTDLEKMLARSVGGVGDVALHHFKDLRGFEQYKQYYNKREDAQMIFERECAKRSSRFASYIDHIKYQSADPKNRVGLRELLMEPVQRIPRYTLLFRTMLKYMAQDDPQRDKIIEADEIASKIAQAETDEQTKRAAIFYCLTATIEDFPADMFSNQRRFIDCIDVQEIIADSGPSSSGILAPLHCTLFLFDDKLIIVKRPGNGEKSGMVLTGLDEIDKLTKAGGLPTGKKKNGMSFKGTLDVTDIVATDVGGADMNFYLETPPQDVGDKWSGRPLRSYSVVHPPQPINLDPTRTETSKQRFLENLWYVQATYRSRAGQSVVLCAEEQEVESKIGKVTFARTYFNVYQRTAFLQEPKKTKIVVHIDPIGSADPMPFGVNSAPFARIRIQPLAGGLCRYAVSSSDPTDEGEEDIVQTERVPSRIVNTIHQFGLFEFRTGRNSMPPTPTARSRVAIFGLDAISRNLFNARPGSTMGDLFAGSINSHKRAKSTISRSSGTTHTSTSGDGSLAKFPSNRSNSTAATSLGDDASFHSRSSRSRKINKLNKSPGGSTSDGEGFTGTLRRSVRSFSMTRSRSPSTERDGGRSDDEDGFPFNKSRELDPSDRDLVAQLELARKNSQQIKKELPELPIEAPVEETILEEEPPLLRPFSRASNKSAGLQIHHSSTRSESYTPTGGLESPIRRGRSPSLHSIDRRPLGPRSPSPLPPRTPPVTIPTVLPDSDDDEPPEIPNPHPPQPTSAFSRPSGIPRSKRQPTVPRSNTIDTIPKAPPVSAPHPIEPLAIKKKTSIRSESSVHSETNGTPAPVRKTYARNSPLSRPSQRVASPRRVSPQTQTTSKRKHGSIPRVSSSKPAETIEKMLQLSQSTCDDIESSRRTIKRMKVQNEGLRPSSSLNSLDNEILRPSSPDKGLRTSQRGPAPVTKAAQERMAEMRSLIGKRHAELDGGSRLRQRSAIFETPVRESSPVSFETPRITDSLVAEADQELSRAISHQSTLQEHLKQVASELKEKSTELEKARTDLQNAKRQCELVKNLLADATAEKEIMYEAFNEELDGMYNDLNLPDDEAWTALSKDLRQTKEDRNTISRENSDLRRRIAELEQQAEEWGSLLRTHDLIS